MAALKAHEVDAFVRNADARFRLVLVYGPDQGLVSERADALAKAHLKGSDDPLSLLRMDGDALASDPSRLAEEAYAIGLFGGGRVIRLRAATRPIVIALEPVLRGPEPEAAIIVEAGDLKASAPLRKLFEGARNAVALPCYGDEQRDLLRIVDEELAQAGLRITPGARRTLVAQLGGDRLASRQELRKIVTYCMGAAEVGEDDVLAVSGDVSGIAIDAAIDGMGLGEPSRTAMIFRRLINEGTPASMIASAALRHLQQLDSVRAEVDAGRGAPDAMRALAPPVFYKRHGLFERQIVIWSSSELERAQRLMSGALLDSRRHPALAATIVERALVTIAESARRRRS
jgi:DNA polymerase-3 subunit delta